ncbi:MAG: single-strand binding protein, single-strand DNA-binding protein [Candidatus Peregrinibacteria bacterium GW2011_GWF2_33_10]|nr:MAG: single-strand binding protein, single-strand DNA-binding protein [Candidatus Peregrinibacteria bacterium GW2011_GWF2_33_10]OGJ43971.1 MAG: hypothetical protein A2272_05055 [Candidatus Peregrinibacteria bacterium RIFOXYA12_FULL_33_12]OGJ45302.1 MAG: hypothetical protein A2263_03440 [Candidatus Peregrinibacteria bacterium RIFOXYA2_FULL_33_21]OGJ49994.1 MAG: hypothetical protein A2307_04470 [Candidatus Peregrinibacteria bacterium RIFOXYB2_FULL_33_20]
MSTYRGTKNTVITIGNLAKDPEVRHTSNGQSVANIVVATNRGWKDASGVLQEETEYHQIVLWGKLAEIAAQYFVKGKKVYIEGRLKTRSWEGQDGIKRYTTEIVAEDIMMLGSKPDSAQGSHQPAAKANSTPAAVQPVVETFEGDSSSTTALPEEEVKVEDLPF